MWVKRKPGATCAIASGYEALLPPEDAGEKGAANRLGRGDDWGNHDIGSRQPTVRAMSILFSDLPDFIRDPRATAFASGHMIHARNHFGPANGAKLRVSSAHALGAVVFEVRDSHNSSSNCQSSFLVTGLAPVSPRILCPHGSRTDIFIFNSS